MIVFVSEILFIHSFVFITSGSLMKMSRKAVIVEFDENGNRLQPVRAASNRGRGSKRSKRDTDDEVTKSLSLLNMDSKSDLPWYQKYEPQTLSDVCLHYLKIEEIRNWFEVVYEAPAFQDNRILILQGPSGSGKSSIIRAAAKGLGISIIEYSYEEDPDDFDDDDSNGYEESKSTFGDRRNTLIVQRKRFKPSQFEHFRTFLMNANRFKSRDDDESCDSLILVEELPNGVYSQPHRYHEVLREVSKTYKNHIPIVFIHSYFSSQNNYHDFVRIFPDFLVKELKAMVVKFNPVAFTFMKKALKRTPFIPLFSTQELDSLIKASAGDIRALFNSMEVMLRFNQRRNIEGYNFNKRRRPNDCLLDSLERRCPVDSFNFFGKILHAKRLIKEDLDLDSKRDLLQDREEQRELPLVENFTDLLDAPDISSNKILLSLHQNYPMATNVLEEAAQCIDLISLGDVLSQSEFSNDKQGFFDDYCNQVSCRGLMYYLTPTLVDDKKGATVAQSKRANMQHKLEYYEVQRIKTDLENQVREGCQSRHLSFNSNATSIVTDIIGLLPSRDMNRETGIFNRIALQLDLLPREGVFLSNRFMKELGGEEEEDEEMNTCAQRTPKKNSPVKRRIPFARHQQEEEKEQRKPEFSHIKGEVASEDLWMYDIED